MRAKQKFKLSATIIGICFLLHGIPVFAAESSEMIEFDLKTNEMKTVEIEEQNSDSVDSYIPEGISTGIQTYGAIIDGDDRYRIPANLSSTTFPYCSYGVVSCTWPNGASSFGTGWLFGPNDVATAAHVVYSQENGGYPSSIIFYPGVNNSGSIVGASYKATIAVLPATYQSERDETKDYAFLSLNYNPKCEQSQFTSNALHIEVCYFSLLTLFFTQEKLFLAFLLNRCTKGAVIKSLSFVITA